MTAELVVGAFTPSVLLDLARSTGRLDRAGIVVRTVPVASSPAQFRDLIGGGQDVALTSPDNALAYRFSPSNPLGAVADVRIVAAVDRGLGLGLYLRPGLDPAELRGGRLEVGREGGTFVLHGWIPWAA